ncbi:MFS general substrate transporter [Thozetella sp. PMI_491]|nr:MFS general substrate transporter [Thozetella sp. PMI_491]
MADIVDVSRNVPDVESLRKSLPTSQPESDVESAKPVSPLSIPDGGWEAWVQVLGSWVILVATWGLVNSFGVYQTYYEAELLSSSSSSDISWIGSVQGALLFFVGVVSGPLYDAGYFRHLLISGLFLIVFGQFMTSLCTTYWQVMLSQGIVIGIGMGLTFLPSAAILAQYFSKYRALVLGISSSGSPLAGIVFPILFSRLQPTVGFGWATRIIAFILLGLSVIPIAFMHTRVQPKSKRSLVDETAFTDSTFMAFVVASFFGFLVLYVAFFYIQLYTIDYLPSETEFSPYLVTMLNVGSVFGRVIPNAIADKAGSLNVLIICTFVSAVLAFAWMGITNLGGLIAFGLLYGAFSGGVVSLTPSVIIHLTPEPSRIGARMGTTFVSAGLAILVGPPIAGAILGDATKFEWLGTIGYSAGGLILATMAYSIARFLEYRKGGSQ